MNPSTSETRKSSTGSSVNAKFYRLRSITTEPKEPLFSTKKPKHGKEQNGTRTSRKKGESIIARAERGPSFRICRESIQKSGPDCRFDDRRRCRGGSARLA